MNQTITIPNQMYENLARKSKLLKRTPDELVATLVENYLNESDELWQNNFHELLARVQAKSSSFSSDEIEADITLAANDVREIRAIHVNPTG